MRILVMSFGSDAGGIEKSLIEFLKFLMQERHHVDLYLWRPPGILFEKIPNGINILTPRLYPGSLSSIKNLKDIFWYTLFRYYSAIKNPTKSFKRFPISNYDIAISFCQNGYSSHYIINKVDAKKKIIFYHHGSYDGTGQKKKIDYKYFLLYDNFVTVSSAAKNMLQNHFPKLKKIIVINNLTDESEIIRLSKLENPYFDSQNVINICTVGRISQEKGQTLAIKAAALIKISGLKFKWWFVGDGNDYAACCKLADEVGVADCCEFVGTKSNPYPYIKNCNIYVQPSFIEADPVTIREAKILESQIIATDIPAIREALDDGKLGKLCKLTPESIAQTILLTLHSPKTYHQPYHSDNENTKAKLRNLIN